MRYTFKFKLFGSKVQMFDEGRMGIVIEKEPDVICVYGTDEKHKDILCAIPLCHPKLLKGAEYIIDFRENEQAKVCVGDLQIIIDFTKKKAVVSGQTAGADLVGDGRFEKTANIFSELHVSSVIPLPEY